MSGCHYFIIFEHKCMQYRSLCCCSSVLVLSYLTCSDSCWLWASLSRWLMVLQRAWASSQYFSNFSILSLLSFTLFSRDVPRASQAKRSASHTRSYRNTYRHSVLQLQMNTEGMAEILLTFSFICFSSSIVVLCFIWSCKRDRFSIESIKESLHWKSCISQGELLSTLLLFLLLLHS